jgi:hypothetical protein
MEKIIKPTGPLCFCRIKRYAVVEVESGVILSSNPITALIEFDSSIDFDALFRNAAGEAGIIDRIQWAESNRGVHIDIIDPASNRTLDSINMDEETIAKLKETIGTDGVN